MGYIAQPDRFADSLLTARSRPLIAMRMRTSRVASEALEVSDADFDAGITRTADGLLLRPVPDRSCQRGVAVSGGVGAVDHLRRDADRQFRPWRVLHARRLCRVHADRAIFRRDRLLGRHRRRGADRRCGRRAGRDGAAAADLSFAGIVSVAGDLRPDPDGRGSGGADLGTERSARPPRAGISRARSISSARIFRPTICS